VKSLSGPKRTRAGRTLVPQLNSPDNAYDLGDGESASFDLGMAFSEGGFGLKRRQEDSGDKRNPGVTVDARAHALLIVQLNRDLYFSEEMIAICFASQLHFAAVGWWGGHPTPPPNHPISPGGGRGFTV